MQVGGYLYYKFCKFAMIEQEKGDLLIQKTAWVGWTVTGSFRERNIMDHHHLPKLDAQWAEPVSLTFHSALRKVQTLYRTLHRCFLPSLGSFGQADSEEKIFRNRPIRNKNCLWWPCLLTNWNEMSSPYRGPSIDASFQVVVH